MITFYQHTSDAYYIVFCNGVLLGEAIQAEDGYFHFWFDDSRSGFWEAYVLRQIADQLDFINEEWDAKVNELVNLPLPSACSPSQPSDRS